MCTGSASHKKGPSPKGAVPKSKERFLKYKRFADAFSYPRGWTLRLEYDRLFRKTQLWLYGSEYKIENEFQRVRDLADISAFYRAFGLETDKDRPDALSCELEFMHYLIFKETNAPSEEKSSICWDAQRKFFREHLYPAATKIAREVTLKTENKFYREISKELEKFLEEEKKFL